METHATDLQAILKTIAPLDIQWLERARQRTAQLVMPPRALGRLHDLAERLCAIRQTLTPALDRKAFLVMAGDHGVVAEGVNAFPQEVTGEMIRTFLRGGAGINVLSRRVSAAVVVVDMGIVPHLDPAGLSGGKRLRVRKVAAGTANMAVGPAMTPAQAQQAVLTGYREAAALIQEGVNLLGTGDMGIGNTTPSSAIGAVVTGTALERMVGRGTGLDDAGLARKRAVIEKALAINAPDPTDGLDVLAKVGGFEIGGIAGTILAGARHRVPVVVDGFISTAGALIAATLCPAAVDYMFAGHRSEEPGHRAMLEHLGLTPILDLGMRLGEGTGGALAMGIMDGANDVFQEMLTFEQAGVSQG